MAQLYANENFPLPVIEGLRQVGHNVLTTHETRKANQSIPDDEVLEFACSENRAVLTLNRRDFIKLHNSNPAHSGIIVCTYDPDFAGQASRIHQAIETSPLLAGRLIRVNRPSS
ncbi:MAG: DUF5615 family PIN-like protein [Acidobacteriota bacterium]